MEVGDARPGASVWSAPLAGPSAAGEAGAAGGDHAGEDDLVDAGADPVRRAGRRTFRPEEIELLKGMFLTNPTPSTQMQAVIGQSLDISLRSITIWFQNRRQRLKRKSREEGSIGVFDRSQVVGRQNNGASPHCAQAIATVHAMPSHLQAHVVNGSLQQQQLQQQQMQMQQQLLLQLGRSQGVFAQSFPQHAPLPWTGSFGQDPLAPGLVNRPGREEAGSVTQGYPQGQIGLPEQLAYAALGGLGAAAGYYHQPQNLLRAAEAQQAQQQHQQQQQQLRNLMIAQLQQIAQQQARHAHLTEQLQHEAVGCGPGGDGGGGGGLGCGLGSGLGGELGGGGLGGVLEAGFAGAACRAALAHSSSLLLPGKALQQGQISQKGQHVKEETLQQQQAEHQAHLLQAQQQQALLLATSHGELVRFLNPSFVSICVSSL